jgi:serine/threonine-protein kinase PpkA
MEYVPGGDLKQCLANGALPPQQALEILRQVASALGYAPRQGFVHRDVKPENILFRADGTVVLTDFGIAKAVGAGTRMTATGMTIGTSHYMSPEQARGQEVDGRSDIYSLGVVFYEMLTGNVPYQAADSFAVALKHINDPVPQLSGELAVYQPLLDRMLAKEPDQRFPEAALLIGELERCLVGHIARPLAQTVVRPAIGATEIPETFQYVKVRSDGQKGIQAPKAAQVQVEEEETMQQRKKSLFPFFFLLLLGAMALAGAIATGR